MSRSWTPTDHDGFERVHGRLHIRTDRSLTPITLPVLPDAEEVEAWARRRRRKIALAGWLWVAMLVAVAAALMAGCGHAPAAREPIVLPERIGTPAAQLIAWLVGQSPKAMTIPGGPIVVFQPELAGDRPLIEHERCHQRQQEEMGTVVWMHAYADQYRACVERNARETCLRGGMPLEAECYRVQHEEQARRLSQLPVWRGDWSAVMCKERRR